MILLFWISALVMVLVVAPVSTVESRFMWLVLAVVALGIVRHFVKLTKQVFGSMSRSGRTRQMSDTMFLNCARLFKRVSRQDDDIWIGTGFRWTGEHSNKLYERLYCTRKTAATLKGSHRISENRQGPSHELWSRRPLALEIQ